MVDMDKEERLIRWRTAIALVMTLAAFGAGFLVLPQFYQFPFQTSARLALAAQAGAFVLFCLLVAVMMVSLGRRQSADDIGGAANGPPSPQLAVRAAFLQNTLEQAVLTCGAMLAFAAIAEGEWLALLPVTTILFGIGRVLFYQGYAKGACGRALGMGLTLLPGALLLLWVVGATVVLIWQGEVP